MGMLQNAPLSHECHPAYGPPIGQEDSWQSPMSLATGVPLSQARLTCKGDPRLSLSMWTAISWSIRIFPIKWASTPSTPSVLPFTGSVVQDYLLQGNTPHPPAGDAHFKNSIWNI